MKLIVGLGNPGERYNDTRHNIGYLIIDALALKVENAVLEKEKKFRAEVFRTESIILAKPTTFMNESGLAVSAVAKFYKIGVEDIYVIHDDLDIKLGAYKIQKGIGPALHYGIASIEEKLGSKDFWRVRVGVDNRDPENRIPGEEYVLERFSHPERIVIEEIKTEISAELIKKLIENSNAE